MKKLLIALMLAPVLAIAQPTKPELTPQQKLVAANAVTALVVGPVALPAAILSGQKEGLCNILGGTYTPNSDGKDQCPGGVWLRILPYLQDIKG